MKLICTIFLFAFAGIIAKAQYSKLLDFDITNGNEPIIFTSDNLPSGLYFIRLVKGK